MEANAADPVLSAIDPDRRDTLIARRQQTAKGVVYLWDIHAGRAGDGFPRRVVQTQ